VNISIDELAPKSAGFDSGYDVRASMQSGDERLFKTIITP